MNECVVVLLHHRIIEFEAFPLKIFVSCFWAKNRLGIWIGTPQKVIPTVQRRISAADGKGGFRGRRMFQHEPASFGISM